jgi:hypothetical protein
MRKLLSAVALVGMLAVPGSAEAQAQTVIGGVGAYYDDLEAFGIGAYVAIPVPQVYDGLSINPNFVFFFPDNGDYWELNGDVVLSFPLEDDSPIIPFALGGISIGRSSFDAFGVSASDTDIGLNLGGGVVFPLETVRPVAGAKFEIRDNTGFVIFGGVGFPVG